MTDQGQVPDLQELLDLLRKHLKEEFGCHTAILYGSRARSDWDAASDIDIIAFRDIGETGQVAHRWQKLFLDMFLDPTATKPAPDWLRLHGWSGPVSARLGWERGAGCRGRYAGCRAGSA